MGGCGFGGLFGGNMTWVFFLILILLLATDP